MSIQQYTNESIELLKELIETPSLSRNEEDAVQVLRAFLNKSEISYQSLKNNTWCKNKHWQAGKPIVMLNSHIDTVKAVDGWTCDPFKATLEGDKLTGLGSNDAGGSLVALLATFRYFNDLEHLPFNLIFAASSQEESSGPDGMALLVRELPFVDFAIVGEPTKMELAIAEKGLVVFDCKVTGKAGHAAREEGINSIYLAMDEVKKIRNFKFEKASSMLGPVKLTVTQIEAGFQHNVVPDTCRLVIDVRTNECYTNDEIVDHVQSLLSCEAIPRSRRLNSSGIDVDHPFVLKAKEMNIPCYGSPTLSDQSLMNYKSVKIGPGDSARSHTANEYIYLDEIKKGVDLYIELLSGLYL